MDHKFLEPGHSFMECDRDFGVIEKAKKTHQVFYTPQEWYDPVAASSKSIRVNVMEIADFVSSEGMNHITKSH